MDQRKPTVLIVLDGWGIAPPGPGNAISQAATPNISKYRILYPYCQLTASGESVGLPHGEMGNSEVGHLNLGAGRIVYQDLTRINMMIADGTFWQNQTLLAAINHVKKYQSDLHIMGLVGPSGVHSSLQHLFALIRLCKSQELAREQLKIHVFCDGRDSPPQSALTYVKELESTLNNNQIGEIATVSGRYYAMDRDNRWERTAKAYFTLIGKSEKVAKSSHEAIVNSYQEKRTDEFILPTIIVDEEGQPKGSIKNDDAVVFFNFRADRGKQLTEAFVLPTLDNLQSQIFHFDEKIPWPEKETKTVKTFDRGEKLANLYFVTMTEYAKNLPVSGVVIPHLTVAYPLSQVISMSGYRQLHIAETEKYYHVSFFFDGGRMDPFQEEDLMLVPSDANVATYDKKPEMSAQEITDIVCQKINSDLYDFVVVNFANGDMVGHTGVIPATIKACEQVDKCIGEIVRSTLVKDGSCIITADHGNAEQLLDAKTGEIETEHSTNPVPCIIIKNGFTPHELPSGILADVAPTLLYMMRIPIPSEMSGRNLLEGVKIS